MGAGMWMRAFLVHYLSDDGTAMADHTEDQNLQYFDYEKKDNKRRIKKWTKYKINNRF
jgi:hypothetical protein